VVVEVLGIVVQQILLLNEVEENHPVEQDLYISPLGVAPVVGNSADLLHEVGPQGFELLVELLDDLPSVVEVVHHRRRLSVLNLVELLKDGILLPGVAAELLLREGKLLVLDATVCIPVANASDECECLVIAR